MKNQFYKYFSLVLLLSLFAVSCTSDDRDKPDTETPPMGDYTSGMFILNEGGFGYSNASVSFLDSDNKVYPSIFSGVNNTNLGDVAQSMGLYKDNAYIVINNSSSVEVVNRNTFEQIATVSEMILNPRYIVFEGNKGYISNWGDPNNPDDDYIAVLNLETNDIEAKISVVEGPEKLVVYNNNMYVAHQGGHGYGNTISVIDITSESVTGSIEVADVPNSMVIANKSLYVICSGKAPFTQDETTAKLFKINSSDQTVEKTLSFSEGEHPVFLEQENGTLYYTLENAVYTVHISDFKLPQEPLFSPSENGLELLHGFKVKNGAIYLADAKDYVSNGETFVYNLNGGLQRTFSVEVIPNSFYFNEQ